MKITITIRFQKNDLDILVDNSQIIKNSLDIVNETLRLKLNNNNVNFLRSIYQKRMININNSYKNEIITVGDILEYL
jgi:uncharacterized ubiquitin-like protein YukD